MNDIMCILSHIIISVSLLNFLMVSAASPKHTGVDDPLPCYNHKTICASRRPPRRGILILAGRPLGFEIHGWRSFSELCFVPRPTDSGPIFALLSIYPSPPQPSTFLASLTLYTVPRIRDWPDYSSARSHSVRLLE